MKKFLKAAVVFAAAFCLLFAAQTTVFAANEEQNDLKITACVSIDSTGVKINGIAQSEQGLASEGMIFDAAQKTLTLTKDLNCSSPVGIYCDLEGLIIKTNGQKTLNVYGAKTVNGKAENYGIYVNKTTVFDQNCELSVCAHDLDKSVAQSTSRDGKDTVVFESYGLFAAAPVTFRNEGEITVKSGNAGDINAESAKSCALCGGGQKSVSSKVKFIAGNVTVSSPENGLAKAVDGEIIGNGKAETFDGVIYSGQKVYTTESGPWRVISIIECVIIIAAAVSIAILLKNTAKTKKTAGK